MIAPEQLLARFLAGEEIDWRGCRIGGSKISEGLRGIAAAAYGPTHFTLHNAQVQGDIVLDALGAGERELGLQIIGCGISGIFRARGGRWSRLLIAKSSLGAVDIPQSHVAADLVVADVNCRGWIDARNSRVGGMFSLEQAFFSKADRDVAVNLAGSEIGLGLEATNLTTSGKVVAQRLRVQGNARLDGANLCNSESNAALDLSRSSIGGELRLCASAEGRPFVAKGTVLLAGALLDALVMRGVDLDGHGGPALLADEMQVAHTMDLGGLSHLGGRPFSVKGVLRLLRVKIGGQLQITDGSLMSNESRSVMLDGSEVSGDVLIGHDESRLKCDGRMSLCVARLGARLMISCLEIEAVGSAFELRQSEVTGEFSFFQVTFNGALLLDNNSLGRLSINSLRVQRTWPEVDRSGQPNNYAHERDALLDLNFTSVLGDVHIDTLDLNGGALRLGNARVGGLFRLTRFSIATASREALLAQDARFEDGLHIDGASTEPSTAQGDCTFMGARIAKNATIVNVRIGSEGQPASLNLCNATVEGTLLLHRSTIVGQFTGASIRVSGDIRFDGVVCKRPKQVAVDLRLARVDGSLIFNDVGHDGVTAELSLDGELSTDEARLGALAWSGLRLAADAKLTFTNMIIERALRAGPIRPDGSGFLDLSGTSAALLVDSLGDVEDSWGAGKLKLGTDTFTYRQLAHPSGRTDSSAAAIHMWRRKWLARRADESSTRAARRLANALRDQGLTEASRLVLIDAFAAEGRQRPTRFERGLSWLFGLTFGHGLSGWRAFGTLILLWVVGTGSTVWLQSQHMLVRTADPRVHAAPQIECGSAIDPSLYAAETMLPVLGIGQDKKCEVGLGAGNTSSWPGIRINILNLGDELALGTIAVARFLHAIFAVLGWLVISLCIATWSGLFRRAGRE